ncbi:MULTISPECIES: hypothetical protein [Micrococcales]|uniref:hypothetical protein n=1 Tax=Micrococcales TaxID=85006 RepID=UPI0004AA007A|nr:MULTISPECIES: hypothetical protein [Micrococcales]
MEHRSIGRRKFATAAAWSAPTIIATAAVPAYAASPTNPDLGVLFDGGGGANGAYNTVTVNLGLATSSTVSSMTLQAPMVVTIDIVGLLSAATDERSFRVVTSYGSITRGAYNASTHRTTLTWTIPNGTVTPKLARGSSIPNFLLTFNDGASATTSGRITNKIVITSVTGGTIVEPNAVPVDSSIVKDYTSGISPDGIY